MEPGDFRSEFKCPQCGKQLLKALRIGDREGIELWCGNGPCESLACEAGAEGDTEKEAFATLERNWDKEP